MQQIASTLAQFLRRSRTMGTSLEGIQFVITDAFLARARGKTGLGFRVSL